MMGRTNIVIDDRLIRQAMKLTGVKTKREAVDIALRRLVKQRSGWGALMALRGKVHGEWDIKAWRRESDDRRRLVRHRRQLP